MIAVSLRFHLAVTSLDGGDVSEHVGRVMSELVTLADCNDHVSDPAVGLDAATGHVEVELVVDATSAGAAADFGFDVIRTAIHAAGGSTPGWGDVSERTGHIEYDIENVELQPA
jgi:hypothetical protein